MPSVPADVWTRADWLTLGQLTFTVLGFGFTVWQLVRTANAANSTNLLLKSLRARLLGNDLLLVLPQLQRLEQDLDAAIKSGSQSVVEIRVADYIRSASETRALLEAREGQVDGGPELASGLREAVAAAAKLRGDLMKGDVGDLRRVTKALMQRLIPLSGDISQTIAKLKRSTEG